MYSALKQIPLIELLPLAVNRGAIDSWGIDGPHLVFAIGAERFFVHPTVAGRFLTALIGKGELPREIDRRMLRVSIN